MRLLSSYRYDALDRLAERTSVEQGALQQFYCGVRLSSERDETRSRRYLYGGSRLLAQHTKVADRASTALLATADSNSVLAAFTDQLGAVAYSPYGHRTNQGLVPELPGFNGQQADSETGHYLLGNGYRAFNPVLMRFNSPDILSPFGDGGVNTYAYCAGDPINRVDPSGQASWETALQIGAAFAGIVVSLAIFGKGPALAVAGLLAGTASGAATVVQVLNEDTNPQASKTLGAAALVLGVASMGMAALSGARWLPTKVTRTPPTDLHMENLAVGKTRPFTTFKNISHQNSRLSRTAHASNGGARGRLEADSRRVWMADGTSSDYSFHLPRARTHTLANFRGAP